MSAKEIGDAVLAVAPPGSRRILRAAASILARRPSVRLGDLLAKFDRQIGAVGISRAAREVVDALGARLHVDGACPASGPVLLVVNHPGAYDALAMLAALDRDDVALVAADRPFLRSMSGLREHLVFIADLASGATSVLERARGLRRALDWLTAGRVLVQFGAGAIEPDARFARHPMGVGGDIPHGGLGPWSDGTGMLAARALRGQAAIVPCFVSGVHSPRAKSLFFVRWAERRGITTIAPLVQATLPGFRDVDVSVRIGSPLAPGPLRAATSDRARTHLIRAEVARLGSRA